VNDPWKRLRSFTQARIGLSRSGHAVSTEELLRFQRAHAEARDAVHHTWNVAEFARQLSELGENRITVKSQITDRHQFLKRPDLGRKLNPDSHSLLKATDADLTFIISDGLSAKSIDTHALGFWKTLAPLLKKEKLTYGPIVLAPFARVAISDEIGSLTKAKIAVILIGERPGLSSNDSLGIYLTYGPKLGNHDANRNCISNIRPPEGLSYELAATKLIYLLKESLRLQISGVNLKESAELLLSR